MKIAFFSNYLNHHQLPFCKEMYESLENKFVFVATNHVSNERKKLGYKDLNNEYDFVVRAYENEEYAYKLGLESDVVIIGSAPQKYIRERLKKGKLTLRYSERIFKSYKNFIRNLPSIIKYYFLERKNVYLLCASAYSSTDFNKLGLYKNKTYKWGYFPEVKVYEDISKIIEEKEENSILWVARFIDFKHPEIVIKVAKKLKENGYKFSINMIGIGYLEERIKKQIKEDKLEDCVKLLGSMFPEKVREYMEKSEIFLFTSDKGEGWGAVLNEAMNSACAVVTNNEIGSVPFLIKDKENGYIYEYDNIEDLYDKVKKLLIDKELTKELGSNAYSTMLKLWNPKIAAERVIELSECLINNKDFNKYDDGPCSKAK